MRLKFQNSDKLYRVRRKISEPRVLDRAALMELRDAHLAKDEKKQARLATQKGIGNTPVRVRKGCLKAKKKPNPSHSTIAVPKSNGMRTDIMTIANSPPVLIIESEQISNDECPPEDISDSE